jgi:hypothetical protein
MYKKRSALLLVDSSRISCRAAHWPSQSGDEIVSPIADLMKADHFELIVAVRDWHLQVSFARNHRGRKAFEKIELYGDEQILWPESLRARDRWCESASRDSVGKGGCNHWKNDERSGRFLQSLSQPLGSKRLSNADWPSGVFEGSRRRGDFHLRSRARLLCQVDSRRRSPGRLSSQCDLGPLSFD